MCLIVTTILLILGTSFLAFLGRDYRFAGVQERSERAWFLALAGLEYYQANPPSTAPTADEPLRKNLPLDDDTSWFEIVVLPDGTIESRGVVEGTLAGIGGQVPMVERKVVVPHGAMEEAYDASL